MGVAFSESVKDNENSLISRVGNFARKCLFDILSVGPIPNHIAFIMDGNDKYTKGVIGEQKGMGT